MNCKLLFRFLGLTSKIWYIKSPPPPPPPTHTHTHTHTTTTTNHKLQSEFTSSYLKLLIYRTINLLYPLTLTEIFTGHRTSKIFHEYLNFCPFIDTENLLNENRPNLWVHGVEYHNEKMTLIFSKFNGVSYYEIYDKVGPSILEPNKQTNIYGQLNVNTLKMIECQVKKFQLIIKNDCINSGNFINTPWAQW